MHSANAVSKASPIFREAALRRLSSPEPPDASLSLLSPVRWLGLISILLILSVAGYWAWFATILRTVNVTGILVRPGGVVMANAPDGGQVLVLAVKPGDRVSANQVLARIGNPLLAEQLHLAQDALAAAEREARRGMDVRAEAARIEAEAHEQRKRDLDREIGELENQTIFAVEHAANQKQLFIEGLGTKSATAAAEEKLVEIRAEIARRRAQQSQLAVDGLRSRMSSESAEAEARTRVDDLSRRVDELRAKVAHSTVVLAPRAGQVIETRSYVGATVAPGTAVAALQPLEGALEAVVYAPSGLAKHLAPGMEVRISPSNTKPEENGFLRGAVAAVADFPVSQTAVLRRFENEELATGITGQGPVTEVRVTLRSQPSDPSGYEWSSPRSVRPITSAGSLCSARIIVGKQRPLRLLGPALKGAFAAN